MNIRRLKAIKELVENGGSVGNAMRKAGYSPETAKNPSKLTNTKDFKEATLPIIEEMEKERQRIIVALSKKKLSKEKYHHLIDGLDKLTKNIQLLGGKPTENLNIGNLLDKLDV